MASVTINFDGITLNASCQVGDTAHVVGVTDVDGGGFDFNDASVITIGEIREISNPTSTTPSITCHTPNMDQAQFTAIGIAGKFILFSKDSRVNMSSLLGYYAETKFVCDDEDKAELFSIGTETFESSK